MQCDRYMHFPTPDYEDIDTLHKTLLHWLVVYNIMYVYYNIDINKHEWRLTTYIYMLDYDCCVMLV